MQLHTADKKTYCSSFMMIPGDQRRSFSSERGARHWYVDSDDGDSPYYDTLGTNTRIPGQSTKIFDRPGGGDAVRLFAANFYRMYDLKTPALVFVAEFKTYLVLNNMPIYCVPWTARIECDAAKEAAGAIQYETGSAGPVNELPQELKRALDARHAGHQIGRQSPAGK
jgi:hypothetical protein